VSTSSDTTNGSNRSPETDADDADAIVRSDGAGQNEGRGASRFAPRDRSEENARRPFRASLLFIGLGLVMTVTAVLWLGLFGTQDEIRLEISDIEIDETGEVELVGAVYRGQTAGGEAYEITASQASETRSGAFDLSSPTAELTRRDGDIVNLQSQTGVYSPDSGDIDLAGDVVITSQAMGLVMTARSLSANLDRGEMISTEPVRVENTDGFVVAEGMEVTERGERIIFNGVAKLTLHNAAQGQ